MTIDKWEMFGHILQKIYADDEVLRELNMEYVFFAMNFRNQTKFHVKLRMLMNFQSLLAVLACFLNMFSVTYILHA